MKKQLLQSAILGLIVTMLMPTTVHAVTLSPALDIIASQHPLIKTGSTASGVVFSDVDFDNASGLAKVKEITIRSLPHPTAGVLYYGSIPVAINQTISAENAENLRFVPSAETTSASFHFSVAGGNTLTCSMRITDEVNFKPVLRTTEVVAWTSEDICCYGTLDAYDPEGDEVRYEIVDYPKKGLLVLTDEDHGDFRYVPYVNCFGNDSFTYRVRDEFGNYSEIGVATISVERRNSELMFTDMEGHWAHNAAIVMAEKGIIDYDMQTDAPVFSPDESVTREEFLVMVMKVLGVEDPGTCTKTVFADDSDIDKEIKPYVQAAYRAGIIRGRDVDGELCFCPDEPISRAEAAVVINNIIGAEVPVNASTFADDESVPAWAQSALYALNDLGILRGTGSGSISPHSVMNKAQTAQTLFNMMKYIG